MMIEGKNWVGKIFIDMGIEPGTSGYGPDEIPLLYPAEIIFCEQPQLFLPSLFAAPSRQLPLLA